MSKKRSLSKGLAMLLATMFFVNAIPIKVSAKSKNINQDEVYLEEISENYYQQVRKYNKSQNSNVIKATKKSGAESIYKIDNSEDCLLVVNGDKFTKVAEKNFDLRDNNDIELLKESTISEDMKRDLLEYSDYCNENNIEGDISIYSPEFLNQRSTSYYSGPGGYSYKDESVFYNNQYTKTNLTYSNSSSELQRLLKKTVTYILDYGVGKTKFGNAYSLWNTFKPTYDEGVQSFKGSELATQLRETNRETKYCSIKLGQDYATKARSCKTTVSWLERLTIQGIDPSGTKEVDKETYKGENFNNLSSKAYQFRDSSTYHEERALRMQHKPTGVWFKLAP